MPALLCHRASPLPPLSACSLSLAWQEDGALQLCYRLIGDISALRLPPLSPAPGFADGLWQHSCCELFVAEGERGYREFNFAPSGNWAAYAFSDYRVRRDWVPDAQPRIRVSHSPSAFELQVDLPAALLPPARPLQLGATAVIETTTPELSYWALQHAGERPDFHRRESFVLSLP
ncbi:MULTISPECIES: DOMON-like domain-containing protein [unclassified Uliginosibacterium]|uniref:DOMON-like domain-containing protein n=1 Tax=unclassified Uliginosibacterium TaxID=2621521 RepID=UPI000C7DB8F2|nr:MULTISPECIES: DOMON-like domain-containing protein [unclassified Uliginosibacterium]MDO6386580.1 DOMON-like domain-containing protein [Uliginosibacterium sp. 31-12]PLK50415.1 hypothetical protein C0V76_00870 [Uliginosibacterium sp. TH139]